MACAGFTSGVSRRPCRLPPGAPGPGARDESAGRVQQRGPARRERIEARSRVGRERRPLFCARERLRKLLAEPGSAAPSLVEAAEKLAPGGFDHRRFRDLRVERAQKRHQLLALDRRLRLATDFDAHDAGRSRQPGVDGN